MSIDYTLLEQTSTTTGRVEIKGIVDNYGSQAFMSGEGQQAAQLWEVDAGGQSKMVSSVEFQNLALNETVEVTYERDWSTADEFPPQSYRLLLSYDPDILLDGNPNNDDCNPNNNTRTRSTSGIGALFAK